LSIGSVNGREATLLLLKRGKIVGLSSLFRPDSHRPWYDLHLLATETSVLSLFDPAVIADLGRNYPDFAMHLVRGLVESAAMLADVSGRFAFMTVRQRVAVHLLEVATASARHGGLPVASITQQHLADSVGSAREVVARALRDLHLEGIILQSSRAQVLILDAGRLSKAASGA
jgi:CRP/FNR family transcriptional regulator